MSYQRSCSSPWQGSLRWRTMMSQWPSWIQLLKASLHRRTSTLPGWCSPKKTRTPPLLPREYSPRKGWWIPSGTVHHQSCRCNCRHLPSQTTKLPHWKKHPKNCECCHHHSVFKGHNVIVHIVVLNCQKCNQCLKCQVSGHNNFQKIWQLSKNLKTFKISENFSKIWKLLRNLKIFRKSKNLLKILNFSENVENFLQILNVFQKSVKIVKNCHKLSKIVKNCKNCQKLSKIVKNCQKLSKIVKIVKNCQKL